MIRLRLLLSVFFYLLSLSLIKAQVGIYTNNDTYTLKSSSSTNYGNDDELRIKTSSTGNNDRYGFLSFDISSFNGTYDKIVLRVAEIGENAGDLSIDAFSTSFNESTLTWNTMPSNYTTVTYTVEKIGDYHYFDVTSYISSLSTSTVNFRLYNQTVTSGVTEIASSENMDEILTPRLSFYAHDISNVGDFEFSTVTITPVDDNGYYDNRSWETTILSDNVGYQDPVDTYGGLLSCDSYTATGYFRVEKINEVWQMIDPLGNLFYMSGCNSVTTGGTTTLPDDLLDIGVNVMGSWSDESISGIPYCPRLNAMVNFKNDRTDEVAYNADVLPVFESDFESYFVDEMADWVSSYINDPWVVGYFLDNELKFTADQLEASLELPSTDAQYQYADQFMIGRYGSNYSVSNVSEQDELDYMTIVADKYFSAVTNAVRAADPNHLILGTRINGNVRYRTPVIEAAGNYCDVLSINYYREWEPQVAAMDFWAEYTDIPWFSSEYYTKGDDSGLNNSEGAGWTVSSQQDRAYHYENWAIKSMADPNCVGFHWFRFNDNNGSNKGLLNETKTTWYADLKASVSKINNAKYALREIMLNGTYTRNSFIPDANKTYYIDNPTHNLRLAADGASQDPYSTSTLTTGEDVEWEFIDKGNGYWHIQRDAGGTNPRLRTDNSSFADMQATSSSGGYTYYDITQSCASDNSFYLTLPNGPSNYNRLQMLPAGDIKFVTSTHDGTWESFTITEADNFVAKIATISGASDPLEQISMEDHAITIYPNPILNTTTIVGAMNSELYIYNVNGAVVFRKSIIAESESIDLEDLIAGFYFVKIAGPNNTYTGKIVKK